jgi:hypothetical protein
MHFEALSKLDLKSKLFLLSALLLLFALPVFIDAYKLTLFSTFSPP